MNASIVYPGCFCAVPTENAFNQFCALIKNIGRDKMHVPLHLISEGEQFLRHCAPTHLVF